MGNIHLYLHTEPYQLQQGSNITHLCTHVKKDTFVCLFQIKYERAKQKGNKFTKRCLNWSWEKTTSFSRPRHVWSCTFCGLWGLETLDNAWTDPLKNMYKVGFLKCFCYQIWTGNRKDLIFHSIRPSLHVREKKFHFYVFEFQYLHTSYSWDKFDCCG